MISLRDSSWRGIAEFVGGGAVFLAFGGYPPGKTSDLGLGKAGGNSQETPCGRPPSPFFQARQGVGSHLQGGPAKWSPS